MTRPPWFESAPFRYFDFAGGGRLNVHTLTGAAVPQGSRVWFAGRLRAVSRFYDSGSPCYAGAWSAAVRVAGRTIRGRVYVSPDYGAEISTLRFAPDSGWVVARPGPFAPFTVTGPVPTDPGDPDSVSGHCEIELFGEHSIRAAPGSRLWVETETAIREGIDPYAE